MREAMAYKAQIRHQGARLGLAREKPSPISGRGEFPICPHCDLPVTPDQAWDRAHITVPRALGGKSVGVGHRRCNQQDNNQVVTPAVAKAEEVRKKFVGITGPGLGPAPMRCGRRSGQRKTMRHGVQPRLTGAQKHRAFFARRYFRRRRRHRRADRGAPMRGRHAGDPQSF
jgi:hypothetical protein